MSWLPLLVAAASACASDQGGSRQKGSVGSAISQPLRDVSLLRETLPPALNQAMANPYALPSADLCIVMASEIAELDAVLGPDLNQMEDQAESTIAAELATSAIGDVVSLPFRGLVRRVSGAARRDKELADAVLAGMVRRGFLKGVARSNECASQQGQGADAKPDP